ncbi:MAG: threonine/serine dehydratase [Alphaproteobacteria bacterium]
MTKTISRDDIIRAGNLIASHIRVTPTLTVEPGALAKAPVTLKLELLQHTGSFKARGAFNNLLEMPQTQNGVAAASGGNHGAAVAYAARALGVGARIFVPEISSPVKIRRIESYGAQVVMAGASYAQALDACNAYVDTNGATAIHAYDDPRTVAGQGTLARELEAQTSGLDTVLVAVGGGGLIGGAIAWFGAGTKIVAVEPQAAPTLARALAQGAPIDVEVGGVAADSLGAQRIGTICFALARLHRPQVVQLADADISAAQAWLWEHTRLVAEPGGVTALAALISGAYVPKDGEQIGVYICGGNADPAKLAL